MDEAAILTQNFGTLAEILQSVAVILGVCMTLAGLFQLKKHGEQRTMMSTQHSLTGPLMMLLAGSMLLILPSFIGAIVLSFFGTTEPGAYSGNVSSYSSLLPPILMFVRVMGVGAFIRGIVLLSRVGGQHNQPGQLGKALMHILAGVLCVHIMGTVTLLEDLLGLTN